ncbi:aspartic peptidase domain-containing protein [Lasiosphaeria miniovina]|uniref:Aspartic peptidase domain-containing protein n=1 Tax=Lasiosphaeria miniovina TaxID=1954250 RepID=A0AA40A0H6_9PEZI|nr:aspartic peptidase domain-containing protein [Lasiosphaeria miniovina]KAK0706794.1 aspartic peptidase domain-containing protein [Lasiosphaeria miniovina]
MQRVALLLLTLWATAVHGFFPWLACEADNTCIEPKSPKPRRDGQGEKAERAALPEGGSVSFELFQRAPNSPEDPVAKAARAARTATRLAHKYAPVTAPRGSRRQADLAARENKYSVVKPADPTATRSEGVYQDGTDFSYFIQAQFGSSQTALYMLLDSGASTTWVYGSACKSTACAMHDAFDPTGSTTFKADTKTINIQYGTGFVKGSLGHDSISVAGLTVDMAFGVANETSDDFTHFPFDGILGLSMSTGASDNFMQVLEDKKLLDSHMFSVSLSRNSDGPNTGEVSFGAIDKAKYTGDITYTSTSTNAKGDWAIPLDDIEYDGKSIGDGIKGRLAYIDTGTSFVFGPPADVAALHKLIPGASSDDGVNYKVPCDTNLSIPVTFSGVTYGISSKDWISSSGGACTSNIYGHEVVRNTWLLGDVFLKNVFAVFDADQSRIGFATKPEPPKQTSTSTVSSSSSTTTTSSGQSTLSTGAITPSPSSSSPGHPVAGLSGQETGATAAGSLVAETASSPSATPTLASPGEQLESRTYVSILCIVAVMAMVA